jgi:outer membrane protein assembly factor BamD
MIFGRIYQLRNRLEVKMYNWADLYYKMDYLGPAIQAFELMLTDFPGTIFEEEIYFKMIKSAFYFAKRSVSVKQVERFEKMMEIYEQFIQRYPESRFRKDVEQWNSQAQKLVEAIKTS